MKQIDEAPLSAMLEQSAMALQTGISIAAAFKAVAKVQSDPACEELANIISTTPLSLLPSTIARNQSNNSTFEKAKILPAELNSLQLCLLLAEQTGTAIATLLNTLASNIRDQTDAKRARSAAFAGTRMSAKILLALPLAAIGLGYAIGAKPLTILLSSSWGMFLLVLGLGLNLIGLLWIRKLLAEAAGKEGSIDPLLLVDLLAHTVLAGTSLPQALKEIANSLEKIASANFNQPNAKVIEHLSKQLLNGAKVLLQGSSPALALADLPAELQLIASSAELSQITGAKLSPLLFSATANARRAERREVDRVAAQLAVKLVIPTGVAILPAFVVLGIIPVITDLLTTHFSSV